MKEILINGCRFWEDGFHSIWNETRIWGTNGKTTEVFFVPDEYLLSEEDFKKECTRIYNNFFK